MAKSRLPESIIGIVCAAPREGTWMALMPVRMRKSSPERWGVVPAPEEPNVTPCGRVFAQARNSCSVLTWLCCAGTRTTLQFIQNMEAYAKPRSGS